MTVDTRIHEARNWPKQCRTWPWRASRVRAGSSPQEGEVRLAQGPRQRAVAGYGQRGSSRGCLGPGAQRSDDQQHACEPGSPDRLDGRSGGICGEGDSIFLSRDIGARSGYRDRVSGECEARAEPRSEVRPHVSVELHPDVGFDVHGTLVFARRYYAINPSHFFVKVPLTPDGFVAVRTLSCEGIPVNFTLGFSAEQNYLAALYSGPRYVNVFLGRLNQLVEENGLGEPENVGEKAALASYEAVRGLRKSQTGVFTYQIAASSEWPPGSHACRRGCLNYSSESRGGLPGDGLAQVRGQTALLGATAGQAEYGQSCSRRVSLRSSGR